MTRLALPMAFLAALQLSATAVRQPDATAAVSTRSIRANVSQAGAALFVRTWTPSDGLGPRLNAQSCVACHAYPAPGGTSIERDTFVLVSPEVVDSGGGRVFQIFQMRPDGSTALRPLPRQAARRKPPSLFGLGLLEVARIAEPHGEAGIGRSRSGRSGRFGWKNQFRTIDDAVSAAFANEMGLLGPELAHRGRAELTRAQIAAVSQFVRELPPPPRRDAAGTVSAGRRIFESTGCAACHHPLLQTGDSHVAALRHQTFEAYTDLRLHDLGPALADGWDDGSVRGSAFRTAPLWGLSRSGPPYLHDGRAESIERAIELHGGEADNAAAAYRSLSAVNRRELLRFLRSL